MSFTKSHLGSIALFRCPRSEMQHALSLDLNSHDGYFVKECETTFCEENMKPFRHSLGVMWCRTIIRPQVRCCPKRHTWCNAIWYSMNIRQWFKTWTSPRQRFLLRRLKGAMKSHKMWQICRGGSFWGDSILMLNEAMIDLPNNPRGVVKCYWNIFDSRYKHFDMICFSCLFPSAERLRQTGEHILQRTTSILIFP